jgi:chromosome segregation ATPase
MVSLAGGIAYAQDAPSLGDLARQQRQQKEKSKTASSKDASSPKVITNEQISGHASVALIPVAASGEKTAPPASSDSAKKSAEDWKSQIQDQKSQVAVLESQVAALSESIRFAPGNCVANCVEWNEHQKEKQQQVERMQAQLEDQKKQLEEMQDSARKQGYGSAVYDP